MKLADEQIEVVKKWLADGAELAEVQTRLKEEFDVALTYLDTRLLIDDLKLRVADKEEEESAAPILDADAGEAAADTAEPDAIDAGPAAGGGAGKVRVSIDQITKPSALVSGKVTFSDGEKGEWMLDQLGRLALNPDKPGYRPSQDDVMAFQSELQRVAQSQGF